MPRPEAVVLDIGNVLVEWNPARVYDREIGPEGRRRLFAEVDLEGMNLSVDRGRPLGAAVAELAARHPDRAALIRLWDERWTEMFGPVIDGTVQLMRGLRAAGVPVFALSNFGREPFARAVARHDFLNEFDRRFISGELGTLKPEPRIYAALEAATGIPPARILFVDDRPENISAAAARGWGVQPFACPATGPAALAARLVAEGLLPRQDPAA
jgi:2-haloacid dehalogenase